MIHIGFPYVKRHSPQAGRIIQDLRVDGALSTVALSNPTNGISV
ncbi:hypothetical protein [Nostoc sp. UHCC 0870]